MDALHQAPQQLDGVNPKVMCFVEVGERLLGIAREHELQETANAAAISKSEHVPHLFCGDGAGAVGNRLVEDRQSVAC